MSSLDLELLLSLKKQGYIPHHASVIEIGTQQLAASFLNSHELIEMIAKEFGICWPYPLLSPSTLYNENGTEILSEHSPYSRFFWQCLGFKYASIDIDNHPTSIPLDLNFDSIKKSMKGKFNLVTNYGTTEHIANQLNAFKAIHDLTALNGVMIHNLPSQGMINHGLINYNPKFFWMLARSNGYKWLYIDYRGSLNSHHLPENIVDQIRSFKPDILQRNDHYQLSDSCLVVVLQKTIDQPFIPPIDAATGTHTHNKTLKKRYPTVFGNHSKKNYFLKPFGLFRKFRSKKSASKN